MPRLMAFDYGLKRIGIAVSDPLQIIASGLTTVATTEIWTFIQKYLQQEAVETFVLGYPLNLNNTPAEIAEEVERFFEQLQKLYPQIPVYRIDERFTSKIAAQTLAMSGLKKQKRQNKALLDEVSATIILQSFMDMKK